MVEDNVFEGNSAGSYGGAIQLNAYALQTVQRNIFKSNTALHGGAVAVVAYRYDTVKNNLFINNTNTIHAKNYAYTKFINNTIVGSMGYAAKKGSYGGVYMRNTILWNNASNLQGWGWVVQNSLVDIDPMLVDPASDNYQLQASSPAIDTGMDVSSFGVVDDFNQVLRPQDGDDLGVGTTGDGSDFDIGAFEYQ